MHYLFFTLFQTPSLAGFTGRFLPRLQSKFTRRKRATGKSDSPESSVDAAKQKEEEKREEKSLLPAVSDMHEEAEAKELVYNVIR